MSANSEMIWRDGFPTPDPDEKVGDDSDAMMGLAFIVFAICEAMSCSVISDAMCCSVISDAMCDAISDAMGGSAISDAMSDAMGGFAVCDAMNGFAISGIEERCFSAALISKSRRFC